MARQGFAASSVARARGKRVFGHVLIANAAPRSHTKLLARQVRNVDEMFQMSKEMLAFATLVMSG